MPEFKENTSPAMKRSGFKMKYNNSAFPFKSPLKHTRNAGKSKYGLSEEDANRHNAEEATERHSGPPHGTFSDSDTSEVQRFWGPNMTIVDQHGNILDRVTSEDFKKEEREIVSDTPIEKKKKKK